MPTTLQTSIALSLNAMFTNLLDVGNAAYPLNYSPSFQLGEGSGLNQANKIFSDARTIAPSGTDDLDLSGVLLDAFGNLILLTKLKALILFADAANTNEVVIGGAAANQVASIFGAVTQTIKVRPGGAIALVGPDVAGYAITAGTADLLRIANGGAGTSVNYTIILAGA